MGADLAVSTEIGDADETVEEKGGPSPPLEELVDSFEEFVNNPPMNITVRQVRVNFEDIHINVNTDNGFSTIKAHLTLIPMHI